MYYLLMATAILAAARSGPATVEAASPVSVTVYYESLCPDSIKFYINQLYPTMEIVNLSNNVDLSLIPYGKTTHFKSENGSWIFDCHHGERECYGNKVHACALDIMTAKNERLSYLNCLLKSMLENRAAVFPADTCADKVAPEEKTDIINCANSTKADDLLAQMGDKTKAFQAKLASVPTIVFNNAYDSNDQREAQTNFKGVLCKYISSPKPAECSGTSGAATAVTSFLLLLTIFSLHFSH